MSGLADAAYRLLLRCFSERVRAAYGAEMERLFAEQRRALAGRPLSLAWLWIRAIGDIVRHGFGERTFGTTVTASHGQHVVIPFSIGQELRRARRNVRGRRWRAALSMGLLAVALAANTVLFSIADSTVFHRVPYDAPERLVEIQRQDPRDGRGDAFMSAALLDEWREQTDLFSAMHGHLSKNLFLAGSGEPEIVATRDVTVGLIEMLGARPEWGRSFVKGDERQVDLQPVLIARSLAVERFGDPASAVGQQIETTGEPLVIVGVMPSDFRFPDERPRIWRALDPSGPLARGFVGVQSIARLAPGVTLELCAEMMASRSVAVAAAAGAQAPYRAQPAPLRLATTSPEQRRLFLLLLGAAVCLLLIACANVASLELATAVDGARNGAIQLALGATRASLARVAALEGLLLLTGAAALGAVLANLSIGALENTLPPSITRTLGANPIDFDARALAFMTAAAAAAWAVSSLPVVVFASRPGLIRLLNMEGHAVAASSKSNTVRRVLTVAEVALAVLLLVGGSAYVRSYQALLAQEKGFDSSGVVTIGLTIPPQKYATAWEKAALREDVLERIRSRPGVLAASGAAPPPHMGASYWTRQIEIDGQVLTEQDLRIAELDVEPDYFAVLRIPLIAGRMFQPGDPSTDMIVSETFANRFWPGEDAVGRSYRRDPQGPWRRIIGVAGHIRTAYDPPGRRTAQILQTYHVRQPPPPPAAGRRPMRATGGSYGFLTLMARIDSDARLGDLHQAIRAIDSAFILKLDFVDDLYARQFEDRLFATRVVGGFGILAFVVAAAGIYGVMSFLVAHRSREIGIRVALGATRRDITRLVVGSSLKLVVLGALAGVAAAAAAARWVQSQFYGVRPVDPAAVLLVACAVVLISLIATWRPARRAARVDPTVLLRG